MNRRIVLNLFIILALFAGLGGLRPTPATAGPLQPAAPATMPPPTLQFPGIDRQFFPDFGENDVPNTTGAAGHSHYLQAVNEFIALYRKDGTRLFFAPFEFFWAGFAAQLPAPDPTNPCIGGPGNHHSNPYLMYDHMARRWVVADIAYANVDDGPYYICMAVSKPVPVPASGGAFDPTFFTQPYWFYYAIPTSASQPHYMPESIKLGLWPDGYYMAADLVDVWNSGLNRTPKGAKVWGLSRDDLVNGNVSTFRYASFYLNESMGYEHLVPTNLLGTQPPTGTPNYFASIQPGKLHLWKFTADWVTTSNSTFGVSLKPNYTFNTDSASRWAFGYIIPQAFTNEKLNALGDRLMSPLQYRIVDGVPALWANHTVLKLNNGATVGTGIRWYEFRDLESNPWSPVIYQQGTYYPDSLYRWLGSLAVDKRGNMAVGFSISDVDPPIFPPTPPLYPSIRYAGRLANDPLGDLSLGENTLYQGTIFQDNDNPYEDGLWGLQSQMSVDPLDECIFWYTNMYYDAVDFPWPIPDQSLNWHTRIGYFSLQECKGGGTTRVSLHTDGTQGNLSSGVFDTNVDLENSTAISSDGRYVVFSSEATNLVAGDTNGKRDVFLRDRDADADGIFDEPGDVLTLRVSVGPNGLQSNGHSSYVSINYSGRYIVYSSEASNLLPNHTTYDSNGTWDVFLYDRDTDNDGIFDEPGATSTTLVSARDGTDDTVPSRSGNGMSDQPMISGEGGYVVFRSYANDLGGANFSDLNATSDIYLRNLATNQTWLVSGFGPGGCFPGSAPLCTAGNGPSYTPSISIDLPGPPGPRVVFTSEAFDLGVADGNGFSDIYGRQVTAAGMLPVQLVSVNTLLAQGNGDSYTPYISGNGNFVAFASRANNFVLPPLLPDTNGYADIFVRNIPLATTSRVSVNFFGVEAVGGDSYLPSITFDGRFIAFSSDAYNLDVNLKDVNAQRDVFLHDRSLVLDGVADFGLTQRISLSVSRGEANDRSLAPMIAANGRHVAYPSEATNLVVNDSNSVWDVFAYDSERTLPVFLTVDTNQVGGAGDFVAVPIYFDGNNQLIDTTTFSVDFDQVCLEFLDRPGDVVFNPALAPAGLLSAYTYQASDTDGEIDIYVYDGNFLLPRTPIPDGTLVTITFRVGPTCLAAPGTQNAARVGFSRDPSPSFAANGFSVPGTTRDGFVRIGPGTPGDCNGDGLVDAGDLTGLINELFDADGSDPTQTPNFWPGNAVGCNPNQDAVVDAGDLSCIIMVIQGGGTAACVGTFPDASPFAAASGAAHVSLSLPSRTLAVPGTQLTLPLIFSPQQQSVNSLVFSVDIDTSKLALVQDGVQLDLPQGFTAVVSYDPNDADGELDVAIFNPDGVSALAEGSLGTLTFDVLGQVGELADLNASSDPQASFGSIVGASLPGEMNGGSALIVQTVNKIFVPVVRR